MTATILYTNTDAIRSIIGLDDNDISDTMLTAQFLDVRMASRLTTVYPDHVVGSADPDILGKLQVWCTYYAALQIVTQMQLGILQRFQANTDQIQRFTIDFDALKKELLKNVQDAEVELNPTLGETTPTLLGLSTPSYNPITNLSEG